MSSEETELRAALAASITDTHFKPVCYDLSDSDGNNTDISEIADDDEEPSHCNSDSCAVVPNAGTRKKSGADISSPSDSKKPTIETTAHENSADSDNCVDCLHEAADVESLISCDDLQVCSTAEKNTSSWKDFLGPESGNQLLISRARRKISVKECSGSRSS